MMRIRKAASLFLVTVLASGAVLFGQPGTASAHCDSAQGPVVAGAHKALETGEIKWALAYVKPEAEAEMTAAFSHALEVRKLGGKAQELADQFFAETTVRLHRVGEGADYTGIKANPEITPGLEAAEEAVKTGEVAEVGALLDKAVQEGIDKFWQQVVEARERAQKEGTVEALREQAEAELIFEKFVLALEQAAQGLAESGEGSAAGGHAHGAVDGAAASATEMLPLRATVEAQGGQVGWDAATGYITATLGGKELVLQVGNVKARLNGTEITLPVAPALHEGTTMVPGHLMAEFLGIELK